MDERDFERQRSRSSPGDLDGRTPLDKTIDRIGMGSYQWTLLSLCGCGWLADNMWLQAIAIILPRIQQHFSIPDSYIGIVSSSMFAGMMVGAVGWGTCSDLMGRSAAFKFTLFFTTIFGFLVSFSQSFTMVCVALFFLGSSVGGSMPTDGTLILENVPQEKQYLVTALSVFFSLGSVLTAIVALLVLPRNSCPLEINQTCDVNVQNQGWKYLLMSLSIISLLLCLARIVLFRLYESPRYLVHAGRPHDAVKSLQLISRFNGSDLSIELADVRDHHYPKLQVAQEPGAPLHTRVSSFGAAVVEGCPSDIDNTRPDEAITLPTYDSIGKMGVSSLPNDITKDGLLAGVNVEEPLLSNQSEEQLRGWDTPELSSRQLSSRRYRMIPRWIMSPFLDWWGRVAVILSPEWARTTVLVWSSWCTMSLAYTMFNVFFPKLIEMRGVKTESQTLEGSLWGVVLYTLGGCPGSLIGAYLTQFRLGRKWSLAGSTFMTAFFCVMFAEVSSSWATMLSSIGINLSSTMMWAILFSWTPDIFLTKVRGTACGIASALSRIGGMLAPLLGGILLTMSQSIPVFTSAVVFVVAGICVSFLKEVDRTRDRKYGRRGYS